MQIKQFKDCIYGKLFKNKGISMKKDYLHLQRVHELSQRDRVLQIPLYQKVMKVGEETGELSAAFLEYEGAKNVSASASSNEKTKDLLKECYDVINCAMDVINDVIADNPGLEDAMVEMAAQKLDKWESKQKVYLKDIK